VGTALAIHRAVVQSTPLVERVLTVTGGGILEPKNLRVRIGTPFREVIEFCGGYTEGASKLVMGGPMMGLAQATDEVPVIKGTSCILILRGEETQMEVQPRACISCGRCIDVCPMHLVPTMIARLVEHQRWEDAEAYGLLNCFECGSCSYGCPSKIHLTHLFKYGKSVVMAQKKANAA
jgi:electron transport complex protein RnfC